MDDTLTTVPKEIANAIIRERINLWLNSQLAARLDIRVARKIGDENMEKAALENVKRCEIAIMELEEAQKEIESGTETLPA